MDTNTTTTVKVYVVLVGNFEEAPEDVYINSVHQTLQSALNTRNDLYKSTSDLFDDEEDGEYIEEKVDWNCMTLDNGIEYYKVVEKDLV